MIWIYEVDTILVIVTPAKENTSLRLMESPCGSWAEIYAGRRRARSSSQDVCSGPLWSSRRNTILRRTTLCVGVSKADRTEGKELRTGSPRICLEKFSFYFIFLLMLFGFGQATLCLVFFLAVRFVFFFIFTFFILYSTWVNVCGDWWLIGMDMDRPRRSETLSTVIDYWGSSGVLVSIILYTHIGARHVCVEFECFPTAAAAAAADVRAFDTRKD